MRKLLEEFFQRYLTERNLEKTLGFVTDQVISIGTGVHEVARSKAELRRLLECEFKEIPVPMQFRIYNYKEYMLQDVVCNIFANVYVKLEYQEILSEMHTRITCTWVKQDESWQISMIHMSTPTEEQEAEMFFPLHYGTDVVEKLSIDSGAKLLELVSKNLPGGIMGGYLESGFPLYIINDKMLEILDYTYEELIAETNEKMLNIICEEDREMVENSIAEQLAGRNEYEIEYRTIGKNQRLIWVSDIGRKIITEDGREAMISIMTDITDRKKREQKLQEEAEHDPLTGLFNRKKAMYLIDMELQKECGGVLFVCDIDNFKRINDTKGHLAGDQVLLKLAEIIKEYADSQMAVTARLGGDEYILFFPGNLAEDEAEQNMRSIQQEFCTFIEEMIPELQISLSAGGAIWRSGEMFQNLYGRADAALYQAKQQKGDLKIG